MAKSAECSNTHQAKTPSNLGSDLSLAQPVNWSHICPHCGRAFPSCHALGGHQNAHRLLKKEAAANRLGCGAAFMRNIHILSSAPPAIMIPNTDLKLAPPEPTLVKPIPVRVYANGGVNFGNGNENGNYQGVGSEMKLPVEMNFIPVVAMSASAERGGQAVSDEGSVSDADSMEVDSNWELDLNLKL